MSRTKTKRPRTRPQLHHVPATPTAHLPLPVREFITEAAIRAHYVARLAGLPTAAIRDWLTLPDGGAAINRGPLGTLTHTPDGPAPFQTTIHCTNGHPHTTPIHHGRDLVIAEDRAATCTNRHNAPDPPAAPKVLHLAEGRHRAEAAAADTQQLSEADIAEGLAARTAAAADSDQAKEHPGHD